MAGAKWTDCSALRLRLWLELSLTGAPEAKPSGWVGFRRSKSPLILSTCPTADAAVGTAPSNFAANLGKAACSDCETTAASENAGRLNAGYGGVPNLPAPSSDFANGSLLLCVAGAGPVLYVNPEPACSCQLTGPGARAWIALHHRLAPAWTVAGKPTVAVVVTCAAGALATASVIPGPLDSLAPSSTACTTAAAACVAGIAPLPDAAAMFGSTVSAGDELGLLGACVVSATSKRRLLAPVAAPEAVSGSLEISRLTPT